MSTSTPRRFATRPLSATVLNRPRCGFDTHTWPADHRGYDLMEYACKLPADHEGEHDRDPNWNGRMEVRMLMPIASLRSPGRAHFSIEIRSDHAASDLTLTSPQDVDDLVAWLTERKTEVWG